MVDVITCSTEYYYALNWIWSVFLFSCVLELKPPIFLDVSINCNNGHICIICIMTVYHSDYFRMMEFVGSIFARNCVENVNTFLPWYCNWCLSAITELVYYHSNINAIMVWFHIISAKLLIVILHTLLLIEIGFL